MVFRNVSEVYVGKTYKMHEKVGWMIFQNTTIKFGTPPKKAFGTPSSKEMKCFVPHHAHPTIHPLPKNIKQIKL
jgi:hypothetical protein